MKSKSAFTIVELLIVMSILAVLAIILVFTFDGVQQDARDADRRGNVLVISEALEKYYEQNGEYPSVASIANTYPANTGAAVAAKLSIPTDTLVMPNVAVGVTNSITAGTTPTNDYVAYEATSSSDNASCQTVVNGGCDKFTLRYIAESGETKVIDSRRSLREVIPIPSLTVAAVSTTQINASWTTVSKATYELQRSTAESMTSPVTTSHTTTSASATGLLANTRYYFRVRAITPSGTGSWSVVQSASTANTLAPPSGTITIVATLSSTNAVGTASGGTCAVGTIERQIRYNATSTATEGVWSSYVTATSSTIAANEGWNYTFQQQSRCVSGATLSDWVASTTSSIVRPIAIRSAPTVTASSTSTTTTFTASTTTCPTQTTAQYQYRRLRDGGFTTTSWGNADLTSPTNDWGTSGQGYNYTEEWQTRCYTVHSTPDWSASGSASYLRPITTPGVASGFIGTKVSSTSYTWSWTNPSCGTSTSVKTRWDAYIKGTASMPWWWSTWSYEGWLSSPYANGDYWPSTYSTISSIAINKTDGTTIATGSTTQVRTKHICKNTSTGRESAVGAVGTSALKTVP